MSRYLAWFLWLPMLAVVMVIAWVGGMLVWLAAQLIPLVEKVAETGDKHD